MCSFSVLRNSQLELLLLFYVTLNLSTVFFCCIQSTTFRDTTRYQGSINSNVQLASYFRLAACFHDLPITVSRSVVQANLRFI